MLLGFFFSKDFSCFSDVHSGFSGISSGTHPVIFFWDFSKKIFCESWRNFVRNFCPKFFFFREFENVYVLFANPPANENPNGVLFSVCTGFSAGIYLWFPNVIFMEFLMGFFHFFFWRHLLMSLLIFLKNLFLLQFL